MLQIPTNNFFNKSKSYEELSQLYLPESVVEGTIALEKQETVLQQLNAQINKEQFYFITDVKTGAILKANGVNKWLDYTDEDFTQKKYLAAITQAHIVPQGLYASVIFEAMINRQINFYFLTPVAISTVALKSKTGKYFYCLRRCSPFQLTSDKRLTEYLSEFIVVKEFGNESFHTRWSLEDERQQAQIDLINKAVKKKFDELKCFSVQELRILKRYAKKENITSEAIAKAFKIEKATVGTYNKRILTKGEILFGERFDNARNVAEYLKELQLL
jgi:hypothetical protein